MKASAAYTEGGKEQSARLADSSFPYARWGQWRTGGESNNIQSARWPAFRSLSGFFCIVSVRVCVSRGGGERDRRKGNEREQREREGERFGSSRLSAIRPRASERDCYTHKRALRHDGIIFVVILQCRFFSSFYSSLRHNVLSLPVSYSYFILYSTVL